MNRVDAIYVFLIISTLVILFFGNLILKNSRKKQIHYAVLGIAVSLFIWNISVLLYLTFAGTPWFSILYERLYFIGIIFVSLATLFTGLIFAQTQIEFSWKHGLLFIVPVISIVMLFTNPYHHLFYTTFSLIPSRQVFGIYFTVHTIYSYLCIGTGLAYLGIFSIKNYGFFSRQSLLIFFGILISLIVDSFSTFRIFDWSAAIENIAVAVTAICFILAMVKFDFLNVIPIALQTVVNLISDSYVVINEDFQIIEYNQAFVDHFAGVNRKDSIVELIRKAHVNFDDQTFVSHILEAVNERKKVSFEMQRFAGEAKTYYITEITPIFIKDNHIGTILLIKDITEHKNDLEQVTLLNERLQNLATKDWLTHAYNRYFFDERLQQEIDRVNKLQIYRQDDYKRVNDFGLIMFDIDYFKIYNDNNGHPAGDELLRTIVVIVKEKLYKTDILCRYGGEEFAVICCQTPAAGIKVVAEKIRKTVDIYEFRFQDQQPNGNLTISIGATHCSTANMKKDDLIKKADRNLYLAKNSGKNRVIFN